jgi:rSAM/selenodomain-associated transferase 1
MKCEDSRRALIIFARLPEPGKVKTRLVPPLTAEDACELYRCMLLDILGKTEGLAGVERLIFYEEGPGAEVFFRGAVGGEAFPQRGGDLGERMAAAFAAAFARGFDTVAIIGTDSPDLPLSSIGSAYRHLEEGQTDVVFGPAEDGGYYLLAMKSLHPELFRGIAWSSGDVLATSLEKAAAAGRRVVLLPRWYDVDTKSDLLRPELLDESNGAPLTREFITNWLGALGTSPAATGNTG